MTGHADTGLLGPYAFAPTWTFQRRAQRTGRARAKRQLPRGTPWCVEAAELPAKRLRGLLAGLAGTLCGRDFAPWRQSMTAHGGGSKAAVDLLPSPHLHAGDEPFAQPALDERLARFHRTLSTLQERAIGNGRFFPPPKRLCARVEASGCVVVEAWFAPGYTRGDQALSARAAPVI